MALSYIEYTGDGSTTEYNVTFDYLSRDHVGVLLDGVETSDFTWQSDTIIELDEPAEEDVVVRLARTTPRTARLVDFQNGSAIDADADMDTDSNQIFFILQEFIDGLADGGIDVGGSFTLEQSQVNDLVADLAALEAAVAGKAATSHTHTIANVTGLQDALDGKASSTHTHVFGWDGLIAEAEDKTYTISLRCPVACTINELAAKTASGTCTAKLTINGVDVTGITALAVSSTEDSDTASAANSVAVGDTLALVISSNSSALDVAFTIKATPS